MEKGYTKGVIGPILRAKEGGAAIWTGKKKVEYGCQKREDRRETKLIGGKRGERKGKFDPTRGRRGWVAYRGRMGPKRGRMRKENGRGGRRSREKKKGEMETSQ